MIHHNKTDYSSLLSFVPYCMVAISILILLMATFTKRNTHPDEYVHLQAVYYYHDNTAPAKACSADSIDSYSVYGFSRLDKLEISYFLNGKFLSIIQPLPMYDFVKARLFNVGLFVVLLIMSIKIARFRPFALPLIISPQIWYLFSYANSEPFSIFMTIIAAYLFFDDNSILYQLFDRSKSTLKRCLFVVLMGIIGTLFLFVKESFYFFFVFIFVATLIKFRKEIFSFNLFSFLKQYQLIFIGFSVIVISLSSIWVISHEWVNDFNRENNMHLCRLLTSKPLWSPETELHKTLPTLYLKAKGIPITYLIENGWHERLLYSSFGFYGYSTIPSSYKYYDLIGIVFVLFLLMLLILCLKQARKKNYYPLILFFGMLGTAILTDIAALYKSWTGDFQPQGRYFFALIAIIGSVVCVNKALILQNGLAIRWLKFFCIVMFVMACFSFIYVGFAEMPKLK